MIGWKVSVYRLAEPNPLASNADVPALAAAFPTGLDQESLLGRLKCGARLAVWQTHVFGLSWIDDLVRNQQALPLPGDGYPNVFLALARHVLPPVLQGPPEANLLWASGSEDVLGPGWVGRTAVDHDEVSRASPAEWLFVEAWDES
jgi:hypothetical protein